MRRMRKREHDRFEEEDPQSVFVNADGDLLLDVEKSSEDKCSDPEPRKRAHDDDGERWAKVFGSIQIQGIDGDLFPKKTK
jgi:hypothetical protein